MAQAPPRLDADPEGHVLNLELRRRVLLHRARSRVRAALAPLVEVNV